MIVVGIDPDTKATGIAVLKDRLVGPPEILHVESVRAKGRLSADRRREMASNLHDQIFGVICEFEPDLFVVEWQKIYKNRPGIDKLNPNSILEVATVSGMALAAVGISSIPALTPLPGDWAPGIKKKIRQKRTLEKFDIDLTSGLFCDILLGNRSHVIDAISLADWGISQDG